MTNLIHIAKVHNTLESGQCRLVSTVQWHLAVSALHGCWLPGRMELSAKHICLTGLLYDWPVDVEFFTCLSA